MTPTAHRFKWRTAPWKASKKIKYVSKDGTDYLSGDVLGGIAVHKLPLKPWQTKPLHGVWTITHVNTGAALTLPFPSKAKAKAAARVLQVYFPDLANATTIKAATAALQGDERFDKLRGALNLTQNHRNTFAEIDEELRDDLYAFKWVGDLAAIDEGFAKGAATSSKKTAKKGKSGKVTVRPHERKYPLRSNPSMTKQQRLSHIRKEALASARLKSFRGLNVEVLVYEDWASYRKNGPRRAPDYGYEYMPWKEAQRFLKPGRVFDVSIYERDEDGESTSLIDSVAIEVP